MWLQIVRLPIRRTDVAVAVVLQRAGLAERDGAGVCDVLREVTGTHTDGTEF